MKKLMALMLTVAMLCTMFVVPYAEETTVETKYTVDTMLVDLEFNGTDEETEFAGLEGLEVLPSLSDGSAVLDSSSGDQIGFYFSEASGVAEAVNTALTSGKVAFEFKMKATDGTAFVLVDEMLTYNSGAVSFMGNDTDVAVNAGEWVNVEAILDYSTRDGVLHELNINNTTVAADISMSAEDLTSYGLGTYLNLNDCSDGAIAYLDYFRVYTVDTEEPEEPVSTVATRYTPSKMIMDYEFENEATAFDGITARYVMPAWGKTDNVGAAVFSKPASDTMGWNLAGNDERATLLQDALKNEYIVYEYRLKAEGNARIQFNNNTMEYHTGNINSSHARVAAKSAGEWIYVAYVMDYTDVTEGTQNGVFKKYMVDDTISTAALTAPTMNDLLASGKICHAQLVNGNTDADAKVYLDYMKVYSVTPEVYEEAEKLDVSDYAYEVDTKILDWEFDTADDLANAGTRGAKPETAVVDKKGVATFDQTKHSSRLDFKLKSDDERVAALKAKMLEGPVAFEFNFKTEGGADLRVANAIFQHNSAHKLSFKGKTMKAAISDNVWTKAAVVVDYSLETPILKAAKLIYENEDGTTTEEILDVTALSAMPAYDEWFGDNPMYVYMMTGSNYSEAGAKVHLDCLRAYSVKDKIVEPSTFETAYTPIKTIIDYEFTDTVAPFTGLIQHYADHPFVNSKVVDGYGVAEFVTPELQTAGFKFNTSDSRLATLSEEMASNYIAYEYRMKATEGMHFVFANKMLHYVNGYFNINDNRISGPYVAPGEWFRATVLVDYTGDTPKLVEVKIDDEIYDVSATHTPPAKDTQLTTHPMRMYTNLNQETNKRSEVGSIAYLDYMRVYSVFKQEKVEVEEPTYIDTQYEVKDWFYDYEFDRSAPYDGLNGKYNHTRWVSETVDGNDIVTYTKQESDGGNYGFTFDTANRDALCEALESNEVVFEARMKSTGTETDVRLFGDLNQTSGTILFGSYGDTDEVQIYGRRVKYDIKRGDWVKVSVVLNLMGETPKVTAITINDEAINLTDVNTNATLPTIDTFKNSANLFWSYAHSPYNDAGSSVSLDYLRIYSIESGSTSAILRRIDASKRNELAEVDYYDASWVLNEDGSFADLTYTLADGVDANSDEAKEVYADRAEHLLRLRGMAAEFGNKGRENYLGADTYAKIQSALSYFVNANFDCVGTSGNWSTGITTPRQLADVFILIRNTGLEIDETLLAAAKTNYFDLSESNTGKSSCAGVQNSKKFAYNTSNLPVTCGMWMTLANIYDSMDEGDQVYINKIYDNLGTVLTNHSDSKGNGIAGVDTEESSITDTFFGDGYYPDGSYLGHGPLHYAFGYGRQFLASCSEFVTLAAGTDKQFTKAQLSVLTGIMLDNMRWLVRGNYAEFTGVGRSIDTSANAGAGKRADLIKFANKLLSEPNIPSKAELQALVDGINADAMNYVTGNKHFWNADLMAHQRDAYSVAVNMSSTRTKKTERVGDQGAKTYYLADGVTNILVDGDEYATALAYYDWDRLPGITAINSDTLPELLDNSHYVNNHYGSDDFVGGVSDGTYGAATMDYKTDLGNDGVVEAPVVSAKKSWFFFDDEFVALGTDISSAEVTNPLYTNLNQANLDGNVVYDGNTLSAESDAEVSAWAYHNKVGYVLPEAQNAVVSNKSQSNGTDTKGIFSMYINHGTSVSNGTYSYIVVPGKTQDEVASYAAAIPVEILANTADVQAVYHSGLGITQAVIRNKNAKLTLKNGSEVSVSEPSILIIKETEGGYVITTQNPYNNSTVRNVEINERFDTFINAYNEETGISTFAVKPSNGLLAGRSVAKKLSKVYFTDVDGNKVTELTAGAKIYVNAEKAFIDYKLAYYLAGVNK